MRYKCLVFDHDDTVVNSTATIHHPCFEQYLRLRYPGRHCTLEEYFLKNFDPGFMQMCQNEYGMDDAALQDETEFWKKYVAQHIPSAYPGMNELMCRHKAEGGYICVVSHSFDENIRLLEAEFQVQAVNRGGEIVVSGEPENVMLAVKAVQALLTLSGKGENITDQRRLGLAPEELLMIDDLKPGFDMAHSCGVDFAAAGWAYDVPQIEDFMRRNSDFYFKTVQELADFLGE